MKLLTRRRDALLGNDAVADRVSRETIRRINMFMGISAESLRGASFTVTHNGETYGVRTDGQGRVTKFQRKDAAR
jgi:hypothetical protein